VSRVEIRYWSLDGFEIVIGSRIYQSIESSEDMPAIAKRTILIGYANFNMPCIILHDKSDLSVDYTSISQIAIESRYGLTRRKQCPLSNTLRGATRLSVVNCSTPFAIMRPHKSNRAHFLRLFFAMVLRNDSSSEEDESKYDIHGGQHV
jgi:hypothetical protein